MQFARTAVIIEGIGAIDVLLHLDERQAGADGMDGPRWIVEEIAGASGSPVKHRLDASVQRSSPQRVGIARLPKTDAEFGTRIGPKDQPDLIPSARKARLPRRLTARAHPARTPLGY